MPAGIGIAQGLANVFVGLSTDTKPPDNNTDMSVFIERDTGAVYDWISSDWVARKILSQGQQVTMGFTPKVTVVHKSGFNNDIDTTEETVWDQEGIYAHPSAASTMTVSSADANDTSAGTGARTVRVFGLDAAFLEVQEDIIMNGQTAVTTVNTYTHVNCMLVLTAGTTTFNEGTIYMGTGTVTAGVPANIFGAVNIGENESLSTVHTIPAGKTGLIKQVLMTSSGQGGSPPNVTFRFCTREFGGVFQVKSKTVIRDQAILVIYDPPLKVPAKGNIEMRATASGNNNPVSTDYTIELIAD